MSENTRSLILSIRERLKTTRLKITRNALLAGLLLTFIIASSVWLLAVSLEAGLWLSTTYRTILLGTVLLAILGALIHQVGIPLARHAGWLSGLDELSVAKQVGKAVPEIEDRLVNMIQLTDGAHSHAPDVFLDQAVRSLGETISPLSFEPVLSTDRFKRYGMFALLPVIALALFIGASPATFTDASHRILSPTENFTQPAAFSFSVQPGNIEIIRGDSVSFGINVRGDRMPVGVDLEYSFDGEVRSSILGMTRESAGRYTYNLRDIRQSLRYRAISEGIESEWFTIRVIERPVIQHLNVRLDFPAYTALTGQTLDPNVGDIVAIEGTKVSIQLSLGGASAESGKLTFSDGTTIDLELDTTAAKATFVVTKSTTYSFAVISFEGIRSDNAISYNVEAVADASPSIVFTAPEPHTELTEEAVVFLTARISDDFGFSTMRLYYRRTESRFGSTDSVFSNIRIRNVAGRLLDQEVVHDWLLKEESGLDPVPGDVFEYYLRIWDNDTVHGPKGASTAIYSLRFPSLAEQYEALDRTQNDTDDKLERLMEEAESVRDAFEELRDDLRRKPESDFQDKRRLESLQSKQEQLESAVDEISKLIEEMTEQMEDNDLVSEETLELFKELQQVVDEVNSPELMDALNELQESMQNMNPAEMQKNLNEFEFNEKMYNQRLERAVELFKQMRVQQDLEEAARRAEELKNLEDKIQEETARLQNEQKAADANKEKNTDEKQQESSGDNQQKDAEQLAKEQEQAAKDMKALEEKLQEIQERMQELDNAPSDQMQDLADDTQDQELPKQMQENAEQLQQEQMDQAQKGQQQMQEQLSKLQGDLGQMQQNMSGQQLQLNTEGLRLALEDILILSERQEALRITVESLSPESPLLRESAQKQVTLAEGLTIVADTLQQLSKKIPQMSRDIQQHTGNSLREMGSSTEALSESAARRSAGHQKSAMTHLNELALLLSDLLNQMMNGSASGSSNMSMQQMMEQLQNLGQQQTKLNQQIQQLLNDAQGNRLTTDMMERMRQLGGEQEKIRRDLKQLSRNRMARNKILGDLNRIAEQMQESIGELQQNRTSRRTIQRQQQILTRMLEATRSLQEKGKDKKREGRIGKDIDRPSPTELSQSEQIEKLRRDLFRALDSGYAPDFEQLIQKYFELLQQIEVER